MRKANLGLSFFPVVVVMLGCGGGGGGGTGGTTGVGGMGGDNSPGIGGANGVAGTGGAMGAAGTGGATGAAGTGGATGAAGTGGATGAAGTGGAMGAAGRGGATGSAGTGGSAVSCTAGFDIDIPSVLVTGTFKINGTTVTSAADAGTLSLRTAGGDTVVLGSTSASSYSVRVVPGTYDLVYQASAPGASAPRNMLAKLRSVTVAASGTTALDIDVPSVVVSGSFKINGAANTSAADAGVVTLRNAAGDIVTLGNTSTSSYSVRVVPGNYDVYYTVGTPGAQAPRNTAAKLQSMVVPATGTTALDIDVPSAVVSGMLKINGAVVTSTADAGSMFLRGGAGDNIALGSTATGTYSVRVVPGMYDVYYAVATPGAQAPRNTAAKLQTITVGATTTAVDIDVPSVVVSGTFKINGGASTATDAGTIQLRNAAGDIVPLGSTSAGTYSVRVVPGAYDVYYTVGAAGTQAPRNAAAKIQSVTVAAGATTTLEIDVPSVVVSGMLRINGAAVTSATDAGQITLRNGSGDVVPLGLTSAGQYSVRAVPGTYDIYYQGSATTVMAPRNTIARIRTGAVVATGTTALDIDVPASMATGSLRINSTMSTTADYGTVSLRNGADAVTLGATTAGMYSLRVVPGNYNVHFQMGIPGALAPRNTLANVRCLAVP